MSLTLELPKGFSDDDGRPFVHDVILPALDLFNERVVADEDHLLAYDPSSEQVAAKMAR